MPCAGHVTVLGGEVERRLSLTQGGGDGVMRHLNSGNVVAQDPVSMRVEVQTFVGYVSDRLAQVDTQTATGLITAPTGGSAEDLRRVDIVQWTLGTGINVKTGNETDQLTGTIATDIANGHVPTVDTDSFILAYLYCRNGMAGFEDSEHGTNGWIVKNPDRFI